MQNTTNGEASELTHGVRRSLLERETIWRLLPDALCASRQGKEPERHRYADVVTIRLQQAPTRSDLNRYLCEVRLKDGTRLAIASTHYAGVTRFEDRGGTYSPFVRELVHRVVRANPACRLAAGSPASHYYAIVALALGMVVFLAWGLDVAGRITEGGVGGWIRLALVIALVPMLWSFLRANRPASFNAGDIPSRLLPSSAPHS